MTPIQDTVLTLPSLATLLSALPFIGGVIYVLWATSSPRRFEKSGLLDRDSRVDDSH
ncbi:hypothetical protein [Tropicibacter naphthalenivorans]|uniref:Uncharacterized protein n=1 Tax=Tropicibacter naphthalenivorans TaxID=441103 RepID=A0A0P1GK14_9RHOB|nr:hypothetical protein [Tropicibacter naphthalenivorans]CUH82511.1 hypothetical protein TRN7648_04053 [Tropicibacter naphthalenivorans]SMD06864.1 hypothetical protein SAMN04488093_1157 [Tropicibacter naphthalenivorans]